MLGQVVPFSPIILSSTGSQLDNQKQTPNPDHQAKQFATVVVLGNEYESEPQSWLHAKEVLDEIVRCRPHWLRKRPEPVLFKPAQWFLQHHNDAWKAVKALQPIDASAYAVYKADVEHGINHLNTHQSELGSLLKTTSNRNIRIGVGSSKDGQRKDREINVEYSSQLSPEVYWRQNSLASWWHAIVARAPASRDYADWVLPFIHPDAFLGDSYSKFWMEDVRGDNVPRNRLVSLVAYYQLRQTITHGNAMDQLHASVLPDVDAFITEDKRLKATLDSVAGSGPKKARLIETKGPSALAALRVALAMPK